MQLLGDVALDPGFTAVDSLNLVKPIVCPAHALYGESSPDPLWLGYVSRHARSFILSLFMQPNDPSLPFSCVPSESFLRAFS